MAFPFLQDLKILDATANLPGPLASFLLRELGAEIIKIESPEGDVVSHYPELDQFLNGTKEKIQLDLKRDSGQSRIKQLIKESDCIMSGFRPHRLKDFGLDFETVLSINPNIIYVHVTGFPGDGPDANRPGHDLTYLAGSGMLAQLFGERYEPPTPIADISGGMFSALLLCAAIIERQKIGKGRFIEINLAESAQIYGILTKYAPKLNQLVKGNTVGYHVYPTKDHYLAVGCAEDKFFNRLVSELGYPQFIGKGDCFIGDEVPIFQTLQHVFTTHETDYWISWAIERDLPISKVEASVTTTVPYRLPVRLYKQGASGLHVK